MNKQELIALYERVGNFVEAVKVKDVIDKLKQLDEPQKVTVPQFVADWIEYAKFEDYHLLGAMDSIAISGRKNLDEWFRGDDDNMELFARAWIDGYEVEKENRYIVKLKGINSESEYLYYGMGSCTWRFREKNESGYFRKEHTQKELEKAGFGEVFNSPLFEVEEVE